MSDSVLTKQRDSIYIITLNRPDKRNAVDRPTADALRAAFDHFEQDPTLHVAILHGAGGNFCAGADLSAMGDPALRNEVEATGTGPGPMGPSRMLLSKPVIAAVSGFAVAGGLELALFCDLRVMEYTATFGVFCRRWGVPLIDGGTLCLPRLHRLIDHSRAMDMILTGRPVNAEEALQIGYPPTNNGTRSRKPPCVTKAPGGVAVVFEETLAGAGSLRTRRRPPWNL